MNKSQKRADFSVTLAHVSHLLISILWTGAVSRKWRSYTTAGWIIFLAWTAALVWAPQGGILRVCNLVGILSSRKAAWINTHVARWGQEILISFGTVGIWLFIRGFKTWLLMTRYQKAIDHLGLKTATGLVPIVIKVVELGNSQRKILIRAIGIDVAVFREKKGALESGFNTIVQQVRVSTTNRQLIEIFISDRELPSSIRFEDHAQKLTHPYTFLVGEGMDGFIVGDLCELHHMLIAGATGGGKSVFFKQCLLGLLMSSRYIQLYLLDLKRGVDVRPFEVLENVAIAKDALSAIGILKEWLLRWTDASFFSRSTVTPKLTLSGTV